MVKFPPTVTSASTTSPTTTAGRSENNPSNPRAVSGHRGFGRRGRGDRAGDGEYELAGAGGAAEGLPRRRRTLSGRLPPARRGRVLPGDNGELHRTFEGGETAVYFAGDVPDAAAASRFDGTELALDGGWTMRKLVSHEAGAEDLEIRTCVEPETPTLLGDWRDALGGEFSGKVSYRTRFRAGQGGRVQLDLGGVRWCASVRLDGKDLEPRFFGPFRWEFDLESGDHELEVVVANLLANQLGSGRIRNRLADEFPPCDNYERYQRAFDRENHESGLYGPVMLRYERGL